jgi:hypothetical protein
VCGESAAHMSAADPLAPGASQQDYWQVLESYERHLAAKRQKTQSWKSHLPAAERHVPATVEEQLQVIEPAETAPAVLDRPATLVEAALGPEAPMVAPQAAAATSTAAAPAAPAPLEDVADVSTDEEDFVDDSEDEDEEAPAGAHAAPEFAAHAEYAGTSAGAASDEEAAEENGDEGTAVATLPDRFARPGRTGWADRNKHKYACQAGGQEVFDKNELIARMPLWGPNPGPARVDGLILATDVVGPRVPGQASWTSWPRSTRRKGWSSGASTPTPRRRRSCAASTLRSSRPRRSSTSRASARRWRPRSRRSSARASCAGSTTCRATRDSRSSRACARCTA